jgi:polar amino acid transport system substrate-binding protein
LEGLKINLKRIFMVLTVLLISFLMISSVSAGWFDFLGDDSSAENNETNFVVGYFVEFPPFEYTDDNGEVTGFDLDLAQEVCDRNNWTLVKHQIIDWDSKEAELDSGAIDCIWSGFTINGREDDYAWSEPYFNNSQVFVVKADSDIYSVEDLEGKDIDVEMGSSAITDLENNKELKEDFANIYEITEYDTSFMDLESGTCDAVLGDCEVMKYIINTKYNEEDYKILETPLSIEQYGVGFSKDNTELRDQVQKTLNEMYEDGTIDKIAQKYKDYGVPEGVIYP